MKKVKGITLIEIILYLSLFSVFIITIIQFFVDVNLVNKSASVRIGVQNNAMFITNHMEDQIDIYYELIEANSTLETPNSSVYLQKQSDGNVVLYNLNGGILYFGNGVNQYSLNHTGIIVSEFYVSEIIDESAVIQGIRVTITLRDEDDANISETFTTSYLL